MKNNTYAESSNGGEIDIHIESTKNLIAALEDEYGTSIVVTFDKTKKLFISILQSKETNWLFSLEVPVVIPVVSLKQVINWIVKN